MFLAEKAGIAELSDDSLYTVYKVMGWRTPANPHASLHNAIVRDHYFTGWKDGHTSLSNKGDNFGRIDAKAAKAKKD